MCSLFTIPGGISSTPLVISHRYVCPEQKRCMKKSSKSWTEALRLSVSTHSGREIGENHVASSIPVVCCVTCTLWFWQANPRFKTDNLTQSFRLHHLKCIALLTSSNASGYSLWRSCLQSGSSCFVQELTLNITSLSITITGHFSIESLWISIR